MSFNSLPSLTEQRILDFISANYSGTYNLKKAFSVEPAILPLILVEAGPFKQVEPGTGMFEGNILVHIETQIDDVTDPFSIHDATTGAIYDLLNPPTLISYVNAQESFHVHGFYLDSYEQGAQERSLITHLKFKIYCQTLAA